MISSLLYVSAKSMVEETGDRGSSFEGLNETLACHGCDELLSTTSIGHLVQVPDALGTLIWEMASIKELFPALWFPMRAIFGSFITSSIPASRSILVSLFNSCREKA